MIRKYTTSFLALIGAVATLSAAQTIRITVSNPLAFDRHDEIVEIPLDSLSPASGQSFRILGPDNREIGDQITYDRKVIFPASVEASSSATYTATPGHPTVGADTVSCGVLYKYRLDDIAWENDKSGYRLYGPAIQQRGDKLYGYDIFTKRATTSPVLRERYELECNQQIREKINRLRKAGQTEKADSLYRIISYHIDSGTGMDVYTVGPTLGAGCSALMRDDLSLAYPYCYTDFEILDNGPYRFTVRLQFGPVDVEGDSVTETRLLSLDAGTHFNRCEITYGGLTRTRPVASGIVVHRQNPGGYRIDPDHGFVAYADSTDHADRDNGVIYISVIAPDAPSATIVQPMEPQGDAIGHVLTATPCKPGSTYIYWWGSGWSKAGIESPDEWMEITTRSAESLRHPLKATLQSNNPDSQEYRRQH